MTTLLLSNYNMKNNKNRITAHQVERAFDKLNQKNYPGELTNYSVAVCRLGSTQGFLESALMRLSQKDLQELIRIHNLSV